jgi:hypothetical protein
MFASRGLYRDGGTLAILLNDSIDLTKRIWPAPSVLSVVNIPTAFSPCASN